jgi:lantibiotic biosynthesis protein
VGGLVGYGIYALEHPCRKFGGEMIAQVMRHLTDCSTKIVDGITWKTPPRLLPPHQRELFPNGYHNLGLAHGIAGIVGLLSRCIEADFHADQAKLLLSLTIRWLLEVRQSVEAREQSSGNNFYFPDWLESKGSRPLAWCYGDLGMSVVLCRAGQACGIPKWRELALLIARDCADRKGLKSAVVDMGLCHGSAGAALIFLRLWQHTGEETFADACRYWVSRTLEMRKPEFKYSAGVFSLEGIGDNRSQVEKGGYMTGAAGVGLALLACMTNCTARWDAPMLTDLPPYGRQ